MRRGGPKGGPVFVDVLLADPPQGEEDGEHKNKYDQGMDFFDDLPPAYLNKQLQALVRAGILSSTPGPRGGFRLARRLEDISVLDVVVAGELPAAVGHGQHEGGRAEADHDRRRQALADQLRGGTEPQLVVHQPDEEHQGRRDQDPAADGGEHDGNRRPRLDPRRAAHRVRRRRPRPPGIAGPLRAGSSLRSTA